MYTTNQLARYLGKKVKVAHTRLPSVGLRLILVLDSQPAGDASHKPDGRLPLLFARPAVTLTTQPLKGLLPISLLGEQGTMDVNSLPKTATRQLRDCDLNPGLLRLSPAR